MLILTRKVDEEIIFYTADGEVTIKILNHVTNQYGDARYKIGINTPMMLIVTPKAYEEIIVHTKDGDVTIKILNHMTNEYGDARYKIGINAPKSVNVVRSELVKRHATNKQNFNR